jgi:aryl-alcohol dehydrogenase-like predicted oxidoreductase
MGSNLTASKGMPILTATRLALGTAQFGLRYGVANTSGQVSLADAMMIIGQAQRGGIDTLDTAIAYGDSESRLGKIGVTGWRVVTKLPPLPEDCVNVRRWVQGCVSDSLDRLKVPSLYGLLLHRSGDLLGPRGDELHSAILQLKSRSVTQKIGVSIYGPVELDKLEGRFVFDMVQAPFNVLDRRLHTSGWMDRLKAMGVEVHTRSAFLQGLLLMKASSRPGKFARWDSIWNTWHTWLADSMLTPIEACLGFLMQYSAIERIVVGIESAAQLSQALSVSVQRREVPPLELSTESLDLIDPSRWSSM